MATNLTGQLAHLSSPNIGDVRPRMAKANLPKAENRAEWALIGKAIERTMGALSLKEFADRIDRDERQVGRWIEGKERPQVDAVFAIAAFRAPLVIALAELAEDVSIETTITVRRAG
jgi:hypothetical protein